MNSCSVLNKGKSAIPPLFNGPEVPCFTSDKTNLFSEIISKNSNLDSSGTCLPDFPSRNNLKLHNIVVSLVLAKKITTNFDLPKAFDPDCIPVVVLKN